MRSRDELELGWKRDGGITDLQKSQKNGKPGLVGGRKLDLDVTREQASRTWSYQNE